MTLPLTLPDGSTSSTYNQTFSMSGTTVSPVTFTLTAGTLPNGLTLNPFTGNLSGTPSLEGQFTFEITASDDAGCSVSRSYTVEINSCLFCDEFDDDVLPNWDNIKSS